MIATQSSWSRLPKAPNIIAPRHSVLTFTPVVPSVRYFIAAEATRGGAAMAPGSPPAQRLGGPGRSPDRHRPNEPTRPSSDDPVAGRARITPSQSDPEPDKPVPRISPRGGLGLGFSRGVG